MPTNEEDRELAPEPGAGAGRAGRDEMNLAEFPFATLSRRPDERDQIVHEAWVMMAGRMPTSRRH